MTAIERELVELKTRVERLEAKLYGIATPEMLTQPSAPQESPDAEQLLAWLETEGVIRRPTPEEQHLAAEWDRLREDEKQEHIQFMHHLHLEPPLSQIIIQSRQ